MLDEKPYTFTGIKDYNYLIYATVRMATKTLTVEET